jgi:hypothetical protein
MPAYIRKKNVPVSMKVVLITMNLLHEMDGKGPECDKEDEDEHIVPVI